MKTSKSNLTIAFCLLFVAFNFVASAKQKIKFDSLSCLVIDGKISNADEGIDGTCKVELISAEGVLDSAILKEGKKHFEFVLEKNRYYAIRISKKGYIPKLISVHTELVTQNDMVYSFEFETGLIKDGAAKAFNEDILDFPVAIITFDYQQDEFSYNQEYTDYIKKELRHVRASKNHSNRENLTARANASASE